MRAGDKIEGKVVLNAVCVLKNGLKQKCVRLKNAPKRMQNGF